MRTLRSQVTQEYEAAMSISAFQCPLGIMIGWSYPVIIPALQPRASKGGMERLFKIPSLPQHLNYPPKIMISELLVTQKPPQSKAIQS